MNERRNDFELLRQFVQHSDQSAFTSLVRQHLDLVYATAIRKVEDPGAAEEVAQNVFQTLARKAWQFAPDDSLAAWLYRTTLLEAKEWLRGELRRRRRELTAAELGTTMKTADEQATFRALLPMLDEALGSLRDKDRTALLLRFYESQSLRDVGASLGVSEDTAQKRVTAALGKISHFFQRRGFRTATVAAATAALQHTALSAPAPTVTAVVVAASKCAPPVWTGFSIVARLASLTKAQAAAACLALALAPIAWQARQVHSSRQNSSTLEQQVVAIQKQHEHASAELEQLKAEDARLTAVIDLAAQSGARGVEAAQKLAAFKARLQTADYRWHDDWPFAWVPKTVLPSMSPPVKQGGPAESLQAKIGDLLNLNPKEQAATDELFSKYFAAVDKVVEACVYETNRAPEFHLPAGAESTIFAMQPVGDAVSNLVDELFLNLANTLGPERMALLNPNEAAVAQGEQMQSVGFGMHGPDGRAEVAANLLLKEGAEPMVSFSGNFGLVTQARPLKWFQALALEPGASQDRAAHFTGDLIVFPKPLQVRLEKWVSDQIATRLTPADHP